VFLVTSIVITFRGTLRFIAAIYLLQLIFRNKSRNSAACVPFPELEKKPPLAPA
jgi:hypothetical protein